MVFRDVENTVRKYMLLEDGGVVRLLCSTLVSNYLPTPPSWLFIVGASSGGKSMLLQALKNVTGIYELDDMTAQTFASGMKGKSENSLLYTLPTNGTVLIKDYTTILSKDKESRGQILGQMRKIFDGDYRKKFGNGEEVTWKGKMGMLAGVTTKIYSTEASGDNAALGERYIYYKMDMPDRFDVGMIAGQETKGREGDIAMAEAFTAYLNPIIQKMNEQQRDGIFVMPELNLETLQEIVKLSEMTTRARSALERNKYSRDKDIEMAHDLEMTPRFVKSLCAIARGQLLLHRTDGEPEELTEQDKAILFKISLDSIPKQRSALLEALTVYGTATEAGLRETLGLPAQTIKYFLSDLSGVGMVMTQKVGTWQYELAPQYRDLMAKYKHLDKGTAVLSSATDMDIIKEEDTTPAIDITEIDSLFGE